jgi:hypothetical protein
MSRKDYDLKGSIKNISGRNSQTIWRQQKLTGGKPPVVK